MSAVLLSAVVAVTPVASAPAAAGDAEDLLGLLIGIGAIYAIGRAIEEDRKESRAPKRAAPHKRARVLPRRCLRTFEGRRGEVRGFGARCLENRGVRLSRLPDDCETRIRTERGPRTVYRARCVRHAGWDLSGDGWQRPRY